MNLNLRTQILVILVMIFCAPNLWAEVCDGPFLTPQETVESILSAEEQIQVDLGEELISEALAVSLYADLQKKKDKLIAEIGEQSYLEILADTANSEANSNKQEPKAKQSRVGQTKFGVPSIFEKRWQFEMDTSEAALDFLPSSDSNDDAHLAWQSIRNSEYRLNTGPLIRHPIPSDPNYHDLSSVDVKDRHINNVLAKFSPNSGSFYWGYSGGIVYRDPIDKPEFRPLMANGLKTIVDGYDSIQLDEENQLALATNAAEGKITIWKDTADSDEVYREFEIYKGGPEFVSARINPHEKTILMLHSGGHIREYDIETKDFIWDYDLKVDDPQKVRSFQKSGPNIYLVNESGNLEYWNFKNDQSHHRTPLNQHVPVWSANTTFSDNGRFAVAIFRKTIGGTDHFKFQVYELSYGGKPHGVIHENEFSQTRGFTYPAARFSAGGRYITFKIGHEPPIVSVYQLLPETTDFDEEAIQ